MCGHDHLHALKLSTCQGHRSAGQLHLPIFCCFIDWQKLLEIFSLEEVVELGAWWKQAYSYFLSTLWGFNLIMQILLSCQDPYVGLWFVSGIVGLWKRNRRCCILTMLLKPTTTQASLPIFSMCNSLSLSPWQKLPNMVWAIFNVLLHSKHCG